MFRVHMRGHCGPWWGPFEAHPGYGYLSREDHIRLLEEHQRDLEQELADVADEIRRLKEGRPEERAPA